ncbi:putative transcription factor bHLH family [Rosa chinensis]|uniref:Putative transcription factor bHLH family n=1 Tax=Rosa chinensis TaxID=74649 RepID=A0A2P6PLR0_ROSCH|nr:transcription factor bHLH113 isoform X2 [Rosa chinensis]PRQ22849.1 putative transcription factor bHLH family [Rosa chinensis]
MAGKEGFEVDQLGVIEGTSFSQLLYEVEHDVVGLCVDDHQSQIFNYNTNSCSSLYSATDLKTPKMLCFGDFQNKDRDNHHLGEIGFPEISISRPPAQKSGLTCSDSSSVSSTSTKAATSSSNSNSNKKRNGVAQEQQVQCASTTTQAGQRSSKKPKTDKPAAGKRREKLGERISALQQLVSPFGKTDTASVLHEAMGYIRFLHDQVQVLCSPYLKRLPSLPEGGGDGAEKKDEEARSNDLRSRGLCLVPMENTAHLANNNGADFWSPVTMASNSNNKVSSSTGY